MAQSGLPLDSWRSLHLYMLQTYIRPEPTGMESQDHRPVGHGPVNVLPLPKVTRPKLVSSPASDVVRQAASDPDPGGGNTCTTR